MYGPPGPDVADPVGGGPVDPDPTDGELPPLRELIWRRLRRRNAQLNLLDDEIGAEANSGGGDGRGPSAAAASERGGGLASPSSPGAVGERTRHREMLSLMVDQLSIDQQQAGGGGGFVPPSLIHRPSASAAGSSSATVTSASQTSSSASAAAGSRSSPQRHQPPILILRRDMLPAADGGSRDGTADRHQQHRYPPPLLAPDGAGRGQRTMPYYYEPCKTLHFHCSFPHLQSC